MRLERLNYFISVVQAGSFSAAAEKLYTTQSAVSKQVLALERELGVLLFDRSHRKVELTASGEIVYKHAIRLMSDSQEMYDELKMHREKGEERILLASIPVMQQYGITELVGRFRRENPSIAMSVGELEGGELLSALEQRRYDMAFVRLEQIPETDYEKMPFAEDVLTALLPEGHTLAGESEILLEQLKNEPFLLLNEGTLLHGMCVSACRQSGFVPQIAYTGTRNENIAELVAMGMGVSLVMEQFYLHVKPEGVRCVPLKNQITSTIGLVRHKSKVHTGAAEQFWNYVKLNRK